MWVSHIATLLDGYIIASKTKIHYSGTMPTFDCISTQEAAQMLGLSTRSVSRLVSLGRMYPAARIATGRRGTFVFAPEEVERVREQREAGVK